MKPKKPVPKMSEKQRAKRGGGVFYSTIASTPQKPIAKRGARRAKREARYKEYLASSAWKKLRLAVFERDGFRCVTRIFAPAVAAVYYPSEFEVKRERDGSVTYRCTNEDETRKGKRLIADHLTYARFGHENLDDLATRCSSCNARLTTQTRANWMNR